MPTVLAREGGLWVPGTGCRALDVSSKEEAAAGAAAMARALDGRSHRQDGVPRQPAVLRLRHHCVHGARRSEVRGRAPCLPLPPQRPFFFVLEGMLSRNLAQGTRWGGDLKGVLIFAQEMPGGGIKGCFCLMRRRCPGGGDQRMLLLHAEEMPGGGGVEGVSRLLRRARVWVGLHVL